MRFPYERYDVPTSPLNGQTEIFRPEIPIHLIGTSGEFFSMALIDTGADSVVTGLTIAERIGAMLDRRHERTIHGFSGQTLRATLGHIEVELTGRNESLCWQMPVAVVEYSQSSNDEVVVLGQTGFLEYFNVRLFGEEHVVELKANASFPKKRRRSAK